MDLGKLLHDQRWLIKAQGRFQAYMEAGGLGGIVTGRCAEFWGNVTIIRWGLYIYIYICILYDISIYIYNLSLNGFLDVFSIHFHFLAKHVYSNVGPSLMGFVSLLHMFALEGANNMKRKMACTFWILDMMLDL